MRWLELAPGSRYEGFVAVRTVAVQRTRLGSSYLDLRLWDGECEITGRYWEYDGSAPAPRTVILVSGTMEVYNELPQLRIREWRPAERGEYDPAAFLPESGRDRGEMWRELAGLMATVGDPALKAVLRSVFADPEFRRLFRVAPAAVHYHHACLGGLLEHTLSVAAMADRMARGRPDVDRDLAVTGAVLHDIGKVFEYDWGGPFIEFSDAGRFVGHVVLGCLYLERVLAGVEEVPDITRYKVLHVIASHHGRREWGAVVEPVLPEALLVHLADLADGELYKMGAARAEARGDRWGPPLLGLGRRIWAGD
ncbi:MAG: HD domain-containing protein [Firmicutes bacterium]|nr:HD domain-containing protein [Bacillota bacterium]